MRKEGGGREYIGEGGRGSPKNEVAKLVLFFLALK